MLEEKLFDWSESQKYDTFSNVKKDEQHKLFKSFGQELNRSIVDFIHEFCQNVSNFQDQILNVSSNFVQTIETIQKSF
jgi:hypothetical protein